MRLLFATLQDTETDFYGRVGQRLSDRGHDVSHLVYSRRGARTVAGKGTPSYCLADLMTQVAPTGSWEQEAERIVAQYDLLNIRDVYKTDPPFRGNRQRATEQQLLERTVRHFLAIERVYDEVSPDVVIPEVGSETMRTACHQIALDRDIKVLFLMYTIFDNPLRLYADTMHAPIAPLEEIRALTPDEDAELDDFITRFKSKGRPIREYRRISVNTGRARKFARHVAVNAIWDRDNEYVSPGRWLVRDAREATRAKALKLLYTERDTSRPFVYFPLHVTDDYKILRLIPHCVHQEGIIQQVAAALPEGYDVIIKEHPMSIGRNSFGMLRRLSQVPNIRLVEPHTSSHDLIQEAEAIAVISSTVGLEALLYDRPVMTIGQPFYSGFGVTVDVDSFREIPDKVAELLRFEPDPERIRRFLHAAMRNCHPGRPVAVDNSDENADQLADTLDRAVSGKLGLQALDAVAA